MSTATAEKFPLTPTLETSVKPGVRGAGPARREVLRPWLRVQSINVSRHATALRPFRNGEFGRGGAAPSAGHLQAVNQLIGMLRRNLVRQTRVVNDAVAAAIARPQTPEL